MPDTANILVGAPEQKTTGAIKHAPLGTPLPDLDNITKTNGVTLDEAFEGDEYVSDAGLTLSPSVSTTDIKDWSGAIVRKVLESFNGTLSWGMISTNERALGIAFGEEHVEAKAATATHGKQLKASLGAALPDPQSWVFMMKDGDARILIVVPNGQVTERSEITFVANSAIHWGITLSTYPDDKGYSIYIMTDDGKVEAA